MPLDEPVAARVELPEAREHPASQPLALAHDGEVHAQR
jgi:hypothetical protein